MLRAGFDILRSTEGAKFGSWRGILAGLSGNFLFYAPLALDQTNPNNVAFGGERIFLDTSQGTGGWPMPVVLSGLTNDLVSAVNYVNSNLMYVGTSAGKVYRLTKSAGVWTSSKIDASPLPQRYIWDISPLPNNLNTIIVAMSGFGTCTRMARHCSVKWRGNLE